jgi:hypothetical protein
MTGFTVKTPEHVKSPLIVSELEPGNEPLSAIKYSPSDGAVTVSVPPPDALESESTGLDVPHGKSDKLVVVAPDVKAHDKTSPASKETEANIATLEPGPPPESVPDILSVVPSKDAVNPPRAPAA